MVKLQALRADPAKELDGVWVPWIDGVEFLIARLNNTKYQEKLRELSQDYLVEIREGTLSEKVMLSINLRACAECVLLGWRGIDDVEYSPEEALKIFEDPELREFYTFVTQQANNRANYSKAAVGN